MAYLQGSSESQYNAVSHEVTALEQQQRLQVHFIAPSYAQSGTDVGVSCYAMSGTSDCAPQSPDTAVLLYGACGTEILLYGAPRTVPNARRSRPSTPRKTPTQVTCSLIWWRLRRRYKEVSGQSVRKNMRENGEMRRGKCEVLPLAFVVSS